jgi:hypothetical protein
MSTFDNIGSSGDILCHDLILELATKARAYKVVSQEGSLGVMLHVPRSARECEGIDPHTPKGNFILFRE